jgi:hypothetical protein
MLRRYEGGAILGSGGMLAGSLAVNMKSTSSERRQMNFFTDARLMSNGTSCTTEADISASRDMQRARGMQRIDMHLPGSQHWHPAPAAPGTCADADSAPVIYSSSRS